MKNSHNHRKVKNQWALTNLTKTQSYQIAKKHITLLPQVQSVHLFCFLIPFVFRKLALLE